MSAYTYIPTYDECKRIQVSSKALYGCGAMINESVYELDGFIIKVFSYHVMCDDAFFNPLGDNSLNALNIRGITFVFYASGDLYRSFVGLPKFFNINQNKHVRLEDLKDSEIAWISEKEDGSNISFFQLPNGKAIAKTIKSISNPQTDSANYIYKTNETIRSIVDVMLANNKTPVFEFVSPQNVIVLNSYKDTELIYLGYRDNITGDWVPSRSSEVSNNYKTLGEFCDNTDKYLEDKEGYVIKLKSGELLKYKGLWYCENHIVFTDRIHYFNHIIRKIIGNSIDDVKPRVTDPYVMMKIESSENAIINYKAKVFEYIKEHINFYRENGIKNLALKHANDEFFCIFVKAIKTNFDEFKVDELINDNILKRCYKESNAKKFVDEYTTT